MSLFCIRRDDSQSNDVHSWPDLGDQSKQDPRDSIGLGSELNTTDTSGLPVQGTVTGLAVVDGHLHVDVRKENQ